MQTRKKLLAAALATALPLAAIAQDKPAAPPEPKTTITWYGTLNVNLQLTQAKGATNSAAAIDDRWGVSIDSSNIGVRGQIDVNPWIGATFQCETGANVDGIANAALCNRNSRVGLTGKQWGTLWYGNWDSPVKSGAFGTKADDPFGNTDVYDHANIMGSPGFNYRSGAWINANPGAATAAVVAGSAVGGFDLRAGNSVGYWTPKLFNMVSAKLQYGVNEFAATPKAEARNPIFFAGVVNVDYGPASVFVSYERHDDGFALALANGNSNAATTTGAFGATRTNDQARGTKDDIVRVGAGYELALGGFGTITPVAWFEQLKLTQESALGATTATGSVSEFKRTAWMVGAKYRYHAHELRVRYSSADAGDAKLVGGGAATTDGYGASNLALGYAYHLHKTVQLYAFWTKINNDRRAQYTFSVSGPGFATAVPAGADPQALGLGVRYAF